MTIFGESHGVAVGLVLDGCPAGLSLTAEDFHSDIERRKGGTQKGTTPVRSRIFLFSKRGYSTTKRLARPLRSYLKITIRAPEIMTNSELFQDQDMQTL